MIRQRKATSVSLVDGKDAISWPIPIWRPRSIPAVPVHKRVLNLLSPRPTLRQGQAVSIPLRLGSRGPAVTNLAGVPPFGTRHAGDCGAGQRTARTGPCREGERHCPNGAAGQGSERAAGGSCGSCESSPTAYAVTTPTITITPTIDSPPGSRASCVDEKVIRRPRSCGSLLPSPHTDPRPTPTRLPFPARLDYGSRLPNESVSAPSTRTRFPSGSSRALSTTPTAHIPLGSPVGQTNPRRPDTEQTALNDAKARRQRILHLLRLLHSLELARQLLYAYNRVALVALSIAPFPVDGHREWENRLDEWWAQTSGVMNVARGRVALELQQAERSLMSSVQRRGNYAKEMKRLTNTWKDEEKPEWDETRLRTKLSVGQVRRAREATTRREKLDGLLRQPRSGRDPSIGGTGHTGATGLRVPGWVADVVPEPFGTDEVEEEVWELESRGRVPSGTFGRMRARAMLPEHGNGHGGYDGEGACDFGLSAEEERVAAELGLRTVDVDARCGAERAQWRRLDRGRWSSFL